MKKEIRRPENWQDFETLCKKLFGEMWSCPNTIKKNGRLGQSQCGVDVYGIPKGENDYWGIQCKGKDNYTNAKLTEKEIVDEIQKALTFQPRLNTFIFTTTATKDVKIEEFIRIIDTESRAKGNFPILLYCWEDIADLIEENKDTYNWYVNEIQYKDKFDINIKFNANVLKPKFLKTITEYKLIPIPDNSLNSLNYFLTSPYSSLLKGLDLDLSLISNKRNHSWCSFETHIINTGSQVIEDWKLWLDFSDDVREIDDDSPKGGFYTAAINKDLQKYRTTWAFEDEKEILYEPLNNSPLIQKDSRTFKSYCIPKIESDKIKVHWKLLARDFNREGDFIFKVEPIFIEERKVEYTEVEEQIGIIENISEYVTVNK